RDGEKNRRRSDDAADDGDAATDYLVLGAALQPGLADTAEQEDAVVGRDREDDRGEHERDGQVDGTLACVAEESFEASVLEDQDQRSEGRRQRERGHQQREKRRDEGAGEEEEDDEGRGGEERDREREVRADRAALVVEGGRVAPDEERIGALERAQPADQALRRRAVRRFRRDQVDLPRVATQEARSCDGEDAVEIVCPVSERRRGSGGSRRRPDGEVEGRAAVSHELVRAIDRPVGLEGLRRGGQAARVDRRPLDGAASATIASVTSSTHHGRRSTRSASPENIASAGPHRMLGRQDDERGVEDLGGVRELERVLRDEFARRALHDPLQDVELVVDEENERELSLVKCVVIAGFWAECSEA